MLQINNTPPSLARAGRYQGWTDIGILGYQAALIFIALSLQYEYEYS